MAFRSVKLSLGMGRSLEHWLYPGLSCGLEERSPPTLYPDSFMEIALGCYVQCHSIEENWVFLPQQLSFWIDSWLVMRFCAYFFSLLGFCLSWISAGLVHTVIVTVSSFVHLPSCVWKNGFLQLSTSSGSYHLSITLSAWIPELCWDGYDEDIPLKTEHSKVSHSFYSVIFLFINVYLVQ